MTAELEPGFAIALAHAALGRHVFPFKLIEKPDGKYDKVPLVPWQDEATTDERTIIGWAKRWPDAYAGWRIPVGTVLADLDDRDAFAATGLELPDAPRQTTVSGGEHRLYTAENADQTVKKVPGLDTRVGGKGWAALYSVDAFKGDPPPAPDWLVSTAKHTNGSTPPPVEGDTIPDGRRHVDLASLAGTMRRRGMAPNEIYAALAAVNRDRVKPPKPDAELRRIADDIGAKPAPEVNAEPPPHLIRQSRAAWHFAQIAGDRVRFDHGRRRWLLWSGHRWEPDPDGAVERLWRDVLADRYRDALAIGDEDIRKRALDAIQSAGATSAAIMSGLDIATSMEPIATASDAWDPDAWSLGCANGVVNLRTGQLRDGRPGDMVSRSTGIDYDPDATAPRWSQFLEEVFAGDGELIGWINRLVGASLIGRAEEVLAVHHGLGNNGKSVFAKTLRRVSGEYAEVVAVETLVNSQRRAGEASPDLVLLRGARIAFTSEPDEHAKLKGGTLKRLASIDRMSGRGLHQGPQSWDPTHTLHLLTNHLPIVEDATAGFWRRIALVPWAVRFRKAGEDGDDPPEDPDLVAKLGAELPGILAWAVRGAGAVAAGGSLWPLPKAVVAKTATYQADSDRLGSFIAERVVYAKDATVGTRELHQAYRVWCDVVDLRPGERLGERRFLAEFEEHGKVRREYDPHRKHATFRGAGLVL